MSVFISYSHDSEAHREAVLQLAQRLRGDGVDVCLDRFVAAPAQGWPRWMMEQVEQSELVIVICTETYRRRFNGNATPGTGKGVAFEGVLSIQYLYDEGTLNTKFIPVVLPDAGDEPIPRVLRPYTRYSYPQQYDGLYRHITGQPAITPVPLGARRVLPTRSGASQAPAPTTHGGIHVYGGAVNIQAGGDIVGRDKIAGAPTGSPGAVRSDGARDAVVEPLELLYRLLLGLFGSGDEFRDWIERGADGVELGAALPGRSESKSAVIFAGIQVLRRRGYLDAEWFARLRLDFRRRGADIQRVAAVWTAM